MDIFGSGQGSQGHASPPKSREQQDSEANALVGGIILLLTVKYLPVILTGLIIGAIVSRGARGAHGLKKVGLLVFGLSFFSLILFMLVGLPMQESTAPLSGMLYSSKSFTSEISNLLYAWNAEFTFPIINKLKFDLKHMTYHDVTNYFWLLIAAAGLLIFILETWAMFKPKDKTDREVLGVGTKLCRLPSDTFVAFFQIGFVLWYRAGKKVALSIKQYRARAFLRGIVSIVALCYASTFLQTYVFSHFDPLMFQVFAYYSWGPFLSFGAGFFLGIIGLVSKGRISLPVLSRSKESEFCLGSDFQGKPYTLSDENLSYHVELIAPTGSGKTNLLKNLIANRINRGHGLIFLDLKAEFKVVGWLMKVAEDAGRGDDLRLVSLANRELSVPYNPIKNGSAPEIHSQIMNSMSWSEDYYRKISSMALMTLLRGLCDYRDESGKLFHLGHLYHLINEPGLLRSFNEKLKSVNSPASHEVELLAQKLDRPSERDKLTGLLANLGMLIHSAAGQLISDDVVSGSFDFKEAVDQGRITYVLMNSMKLRETASVFGKMILQDLMRLAGDRYSELDSDKKHRPVTLIIDEFAAFAIPEFIEFMDRARGAGIGIVFAHQSRADLRTISPEFQDRIEANSNTVIVSGVKSSDDAEYFAGQLGTRTVKKETTQVEDKLFGPRNTGMKSIREVEEYVIHPNKLKDLKQGEVFTNSRTVDRRWGMVNVPKALEHGEGKMSQSEIISALESVRRKYMENSNDIYLELSDHGDINHLNQSRVEEPGLTKVKPEPSLGTKAALDPAVETGGQDLWS